MGGIFTCPHCRGVYYINWSGEPEVTEHEALTAEDMAPEAPAGLDFGAPAVESTPVAEEETPAYEPPPAYKPPAEVEAAPAYEAVASEEAMPEPAPAYEAPAEEMETAPPIDEPMAPVAEEAPAVALPDFGNEPAAPSAPNTFSDVESYANAEPLGGPISYSIRIEGLELAETFEALKDALADSRFGWNSEEIMGAISDGVLELHGVNPTKAAILVGRIKYLPLNVTWTQEIFATTEGPQA